VSKTIIYCGDRVGVFNLKVDEALDSIELRRDFWCFPEIDYGRRGGPVARHPARLLELVPQMIGRQIITMSEHIVLAFQQMVRDGTLSRDELELYCAERRILLDLDGDIIYWPGGFFDERLGLLR